MSVHVFIYFYALEESEVVARKSSVRKVFLKVPQIYSRKTSALGSPLQKSCRLEAYNLIKYRIWYRCFPVNFLEILKSIYFANICDGMPLKSKIFTGVSFRKILGFSYKRKRQLFYYEELRLTFP